MFPHRLTLLDRKVHCRRNLCPRLVECGRRVARAKRRVDRDPDYWGRPAPGFLDSDTLHMIHCQPANSLPAREYELVAVRIPKNGERAPHFLLRVFGELHALGL
jgi:hypothetical protein